jgi:hypothetical protein
VPAGFPDSAADQFWRQAGVQAAEGSEPRRLLSLRRGSLAMAARLTRADSARVARANAARLAPANAARPPAATQPEREKPAERPLPGHRPATHCPPRSSLRGPARARRGHPASRAAIRPTGTACRPEGPAAGVPPAPGAGEERQAPASLRAPTMAIQAPRKTTHSSGLRAALGRSPRSARYLTQSRCSPRRLGRFRTRDRRRRDLQPTRTLAQHCEPRLPPAAPRPARPPPVSLEGHAPESAPAA